MKRQWLLLPLVLAACALALGTLAWNRTWAVAPAPPSPTAASTEESDAVPPVVRQTFEADLKKLQKTTEQPRPTETVAPPDAPATAASDAPPAAATPSADPPAVAAVPAVVSALPKQGLLLELVAILNETKSVDTFVVTLSLLEGMGKQAEPAIPTIIRNAERLGLFKDHSSPRAANGELAEDILGCLEKIRGVDEKGRGKDPLLGQSKNARRMLPPEPISPAPR